LPSSHGIHSPLTPEFHWATTDIVSQTIKRQKTQAEHIRISPVHEQNNLLAKVLAVATLVGLVHNLTVHNTPVDKGHCRTVAVLSLAAFQCCTTAGSCIPCEQPGRCCSCGPCPKGPGGVRTAPATCGHPGLTSHHWIPPGAPSHNKFTTGQHALQCIDQ